MKKSLIICVAIALAMLVPAQARALESSREILPNGLVVLHMERNNIPLVVITMLVRAGSLEETASKQGLASLTARLMTEGTLTRAAADISAEAEFIGAELSVYSGVDYAQMNLVVLKKDIEKGFGLFSDILLNPSFPQAEIDRQKRLIKNSLKSAEDSPSYLSSRAFGRELYGPDNPYGRITEGTPESIDGLTRDDLAAFHAARFVPNASIMAVAGDITQAELNGLLDKYLGGWSAHPVADTEPPAPPEPPAGQRKIVIDKSDLTQATIMLGHMGVRRDNPDYYAIAVMNYILGGGGFSSRMMEIIRDKMGLAYDVRSGFSGAWKGGDFHVVVQTKNESAKKVIDEALRQIRVMRELGVTDAELADAKSYLIGSFPRRFDSMQGIAASLVVVEFYGLGLDYEKKYKEMISGVTRGEILRVARKYLDPDSYILVVVGNQARTGIKAEGLQLAPPVRQ